MFRKLILASAVSLAMVPGASWSLGLGGIRTQSALNEPFSGEIELRDVKPDALGSVKVVLASVEEFAKAGSPRPQFLTKLRFEPRVSSTGKAVVRISSDEPVPEPYVDFLVQVTWPNGSLVKGYTVLLDPPVTLNRPAPRVEPPKRVVRSPPPAAEPAPAPEQAPQPAPEPQSAPSKPAPPGNTPVFPLRHGPVRSGKGLWQVSRAISPPGATVAQTAMALYRNNQSSFIRGDINKLKLGAELEIPTRDELFALDAGTAESEFQTAMRGGSVTSSPVTDISRVDQPADRLEIASAAAPVEQEPAPAPAQVEARETDAVAEPELGSIQRDLLLVQESAESTRQETDDLRTRIRELEVQLTDIRTLLELRNEQLAQLQAAGAEATPEGPADAVASDREPGPEPAPVGEQAPIDTGQQVVADSEEVAAEAEEPVAEAEAPVVESAEEAGPRLAEATADAESLLAPTDTSAEETIAGRAFWQDIPVSTLGLAVGVPLLLLLLGLMGVRQRRRMEGALQPEGAGVGEMSLSEDLSTQGTGIDSGIGQAGAEGTEEPAEQSEPYSGFDDLEDETEKADIISEADVYIAYGRYREAETLLREELKTSPDRLELKFKLAEAYFGAKDAAALQDLVAELRGEGANSVHPEQWQRLIHLSRELSGTDAVSAGGPSDSAAVRATVDEFTEPDGPGGVVASIEPGEKISEFDFSDLLDEEPSPDVTPETPAKAHPPGLAPSRGSESPGADTPPARSSTPALEPDAEKPGRAGADLDVLAEGSTPSDLGLKLEDLGDIEEYSIHGVGSQDGKLDLESAAPSSTKPNGSAMEPGEEALLDSLDITTVGKDGVASDVLSSQWQIDSNLWDEVATKIDLARAYVEMEDREAARDILEEVAAEGNDEQKAEAREMLSRLD